MSRSIRYAVSLGLAALVLSIASRPADAGVRFGGQVNGAFNTHSMKDWNDIIDEANSFGQNFDNINSGVSFGAGPLVIINDQWVIGAHFERLMAKKSEDEGTEVSNSANAFGANVGYIFPSASPFSFALAAAVDFLTLSGSISDATDEIETNGSGVGFQVNGQGRYALGAVATGVLSIGYRMADITIDDIGGQDVASQGLETEDYSGLVVRVAIELHQPKQ